MKVGIFYNSIANVAKFPHKGMLMDIFKEGVLANGDTPIDFRNSILPVQQLDAGFILGYTLDNNFRKQIITRLESMKTPRIFVDSNILNYARNDNQWHRYSMNSVYPNEGVYFFNDLDREKWEKFSSWYNVSLKPWRTDGNHILLLCQRPKGWNMLDNQEQWVEKMIKAIRANNSWRPIVIRMHPGDASKHIFERKIMQRYSGHVRFSTAENISSDLQNCWCAVGYNSTPNVVSAIEGVPVYLQDPERSWAKDVSFDSLSLINDPPMPDRDEWIHDIANIHWSNDEVKSGKLWHAIKQYISAAQS